MTKEEWWLIVRDGKEWTITNYDKYCIVAELGNQGNFPAEQ